MPLRDIAAHIAAESPDVPPERAYKRVSRLLRRMKDAGLVDYGEGVWWRELPEP